MPSTTAKYFWTDEELLALPKYGYDHEIVDGEMVMSPAGSHHGAIIMRIAGPLFTYIEKHDMGCVLDGQTGCRMTSGDVFSPDISFVEKSRWKAHRESDEVFFGGSPDLVVEVLSPADSQRILKKKLEQYFSNGARLAWVIDPARQTARIYTTADTSRPVSAAGTLDGRDVVPGFRLKLSTIF